MRIVDEVETVVKKECADSKDLVNSYKNAIKRFNGLVDRGMAKPRENRLMSLEERSKRPVKYNSS